MVVAENGVGPFVARDGSVVQRTAVAAQCVVVRLGEVFG